ncbi:hypothetical protein [Rhodovulum sp.]|uniref:hypothetical protein n=1 Tax=Rhodovulum sp. TaxID=34009 RepID=UPI0017FDC37A|nr:hypothetical protein [Rhodovulum sp.]HDR28183.1 hypothetical protein [Rhodovulum sp.]
MSFLLSAAIVATCLAATPAAAQFAEQVLLRQGAWHVSYVRNTHTGEDVTTRRFLRELQAGNAVAVYEQGLSPPFARFSLSGSRVAIDAVFECWSMIQQAGRLTRPRGRATLGLCDMRS